MNNLQKKKFYEKILTLPRINLNARQLCDLELLLAGAFSPLVGFLDEEDYYSVVKKTRLANGKLWPMPIVLDTMDSDYKVGQEVILADEYGKPLAVMTINSIFKADKVVEAKKVYGTIDKDHFGVNYLFNEVGSFYLGGPVFELDKIDRFDFTEWRQTPEELRLFFKKNHWSRVIGFQTRNPLHKAHYTMMKMAAQEYDAKILLHPAVGLTKDGDIDYVTRVRCYIKLMNHMKSYAKLSLISLAMRMAGPREALWHALIRKNYGCTHFIVGRDHAGPGKNSAGVSFYGQYEAQNLVKKFESEIGIKIITFKEMVYVENRRHYLPIDKVKKNEKIENISGTQFRSMIVHDKPIPDWFSFAEIIAEIRKGVKREAKEGATIFFTGLPCAGKSTIARMLYFKLLEIQDKKITFLDGDIVRQNLSKGLGFSKEDRIANIKRIGFVAAQITKHGGIAICSAVSPYEQAREANRNLINKYGRYVEVYISTPLSVCKKRDIKGLYKKAEKGMLKGLTGVDDPYEIPRKKELTLNTARLNPEHCVERILTYLKKNKIITKAV